MRNAKLNRKAIFVQVAFAGYPGLPMLTCSHAVSDHGTIDCVSHFSAVSKLRPKFLKKLREDPVEVNAGRLTVQITEIKCQVKRFVLPSSGHQTTAITEGG